MGSVEDGAQPDPQGARSAFERRPQTDPIPAGCELQTSA